MNFGNPQALWLLLLWPLLALTGWLALRWRARAAERLGSPDLVARLYPPSVRRWRRRRLAMALLAAALLMFAAARPQYGQVERTIQTVGTNVMIALDCSRSMLASDIQPNRLEAAKKSFTWLLSELEGNRVGILAFAGEATVSCPMTTDVELAESILESLDTDTIGIPGTDLGRAIEAATGAFERGATEGSRVLILITDGEDLEEKGLEAARAAAEKEIKIYAVGVGTERGAPLLDEQGHFREDAAGNKINTQMSMESLRAIAQATGGMAFAATDRPGEAIDQVVAQIETMQKSELQERKQVIHQDRFMWFLAPALILLLWMLALRPEPTLPAQQRAGRVEAATG